MQEYFLADAEGASIQKRGEGETMRKKSLLALLAFATFAAAIIVGMGASAAFAGESTGNCGTPTDPPDLAFKGSDKAAANCKGPDATDPANQGRVSNGNSICSFSGQNDHVDGSSSGPGGRTQSYGQDVSSGRADPSSSNPGQTGHVLNPNDPQPGFACNGKTGFLSGP